MANFPEIRPITRPAELPPASLTADSRYQKSFAVGGKRFKLATPQEFLKRYGFAIGTLLRGPDEREVTAMGMKKDNGALVVCSLNGQKKTLLENIFLPEDLIKEGYQWEKSKTTVKRKRAGDYNDSSE